MILIHSNISAMRTKKNILSIALAFVVCGVAYAKEDNMANRRSANPNASRVMVNGCPQDAGASILQLNNVRMRVMDEGDMWWNPDQDIQQYFVPKNGVASSEFAGSLWIGGLDAGGELKVSCMTYRQNGEDFWAGPLDTTTVSITPAECQAYDKLFSVNRQEVENFVNNNYSQQYLTQDIATWPGNGSAQYNEAKYLAPFIDVNHDGVYNPADGDYPGYDLNTNDNTCQNGLYGDATLWWVFNDVANNHTETGGIPIGLEIRAQAFEFQTNDAINNATFYNYQVINRSSYTINKTYFGVWNDFDIGNGLNDFTGCDVSRSMGIGYNGTSTDPDGTGEAGYNNYPPAIGLVFFKGPKADPHDTSCYVHNGLIGLAHFMYYNNDFSIQGNPTNASHYYNYLRSLWTDGTQATYGGNGYQTSSTPANYMFDWTPAGITPGAQPKNTDPTGCGTNGVIQTSEWDEVEAHDVPYDRRFIESAGPFTLGPGQVNYVTTGLVWDQSTTPDNQFLPIGLIQPDADEAQALFNSCFKVLSGPDAPDMTIQELNKELIITLSNPVTSNNYKEKYQQWQPTIPKPYKDTTYVFEGYEIFQVIDSSVAVTQLSDPNSARLVEECDVENGVAQLVNYSFNASINAVVPTLEVNGQDKGIEHSFDIKADAFQTDGIASLVNDRPYYYMVIAYAYNNYSTYGTTSDSSLKGQKLPFLQGAHNVKVYKGIPHIIEAQAYGTVQNSSYGESPQITRIEGHGDGGNTVELNQASLDYIVQNDTMAHPTYAVDAAPISVKVVDPLSVPNSNFVVKILPPHVNTMDSTARWEIYIPGTTDTVKSDTTIGYQDEQIIPQWGISVQIRDADYPGKAGSANNGALDSSSTMTFSDPSKVWLSGVQTATPGVNYLFWIRSGSFVDDPNQSGATPDGEYTSLEVGSVHLQPVFGDPNLNYQQMINGTWAPYVLCSVSDPGSTPPLNCDNGPRFNGSDAANLQKLASVDLFITSDKSKWTRCPVLEEQDNTQLAQGGATKLSPRNSASVDKNGVYATPGSGPSSNPDDPNYISDKGMGWFPGYAINVETGERLNMAFGEDSWLNEDNGRDMLWNPDSIKTRPNLNGSTGVSQRWGIESVFGGKHYIYIFGHNTDATAKIPAYDNGSTLYSLLAPTPHSNANYLHAFGDAMWVNIPLLVKGHQLLETDVTIRLRVATPYSAGWSENYNISGTSSQTLWKSSSPDNNNNPMYSFSTNGLQVDTNNANAAKNALSLINVVPNPYYGYSDYESDRIDTRVRITNLPPVCTISIFSLNGTLINVINKEGPLTYIDWNLQNQYNVPIASGMYLIHIAVPNVGEVTLKWFGVMRPLDLNAY